MEWYDRRLRWIGKRRSRMEREREGTWEPMQVRYVGDVGEVVQMTKGEGHGKSDSGFDTGDVFKPPGQG